MGIIAREGGRRQKKMGVVFGIFKENSLCKIQMMMWHILSYVDRD